MMAFAETPQCRMTALIRHFGDLADAHKPCGQCDFCNPAQTLAQTFVEPTAAQEKDLRAILRALHPMAKASGRLHSELAASLSSSPDRKKFDSLLDGLARAGLLTFSNETFTNPEGNVIPYKKAALTHEGREQSEATPLGVLLSADTDPKGKPANKHKDRVAQSSEEKGPLTAAQEALESNLRAWRKEEAAKTGKPAFIVFGDAALLALVYAAPKTVPELLTVSGFGPDKAERYGAAITAIVRGERSPDGPHVQTGSRSDQTTSAGAPRKIPRTIHTAGASAIRPGDITRFHDVAVEHREPRASATPGETFKRQPTRVDPSASLNPHQQTLENRLREWRKSESERIGLPQFFVLGTTTLRSIVLERPSTIEQLKSIQGIDPEKLERFGTSILALCNT